MPVGECHPRQPDEVRDARERLRSAGVPETEWQEEGIVRVQVADPDGYLDELFAY